MIANPNINPVAFHIFSWPVYWYGMMYLVGFLGGWAVLSLRLRYSTRGFTQDQLSDVIFFTALGAIIGGRLGYMFFYDLRAMLAEPLLVFQTWKGGMSFHGGFLGAVIALILCARKLNKPFFAVTDLVAPAVPIGLGAGRIGNFINGELWGRVTDVPWAMIFPNADNQLRHPSQLYESVLEGVVLFIIVWLFSRKPKPMGAVTGLFSLCYGVFRCLVEFYRQPDAPIGFIAFGWLTEGQLLSVPIIVFGIIMLIWAYKKERVIA